MADIFLSYKREEREQAKILAKKLTDAGLQVWWDQDLLGGQDYFETIVKEISLAKCIIVIWSSFSVDSINVREEAKKAVQKGILVPVTFDNSEPPMGFGMYQVLNLSKAITDQEFSRLMQSISKKMDIEFSPPPPPVKKRNTTLWVLTGVIFVTFLLFMIFRDAGNQNSSNPYYPPDTAKSVQVTSGIDETKKDPVVENNIPKQTVQQKIIVDASSNPYTINAGDQAQINVFAYSEDKTPIADAKVIIQSGGGYFSTSKNTTEIGQTNSNGVFSTYWISPKPGASGYGLSVKVSKDGFIEGGNDNLTVYIKN